MKTALEKLKTLVDSEERLVIALTYSSTQQTNQVVGRTEQKIDASARIVEEMRATQQSKFSVSQLVRMLYMKSDYDVHLQAQGVKRRNSLTKSS